MTKNYTIVAFLKFGRREDLIDLLENGTIYMNSIQHFRKFEDGNLRGDSYEGVSSIINSLPGQFEINNTPINYLSVHLPQSYEQVYGNIYSLYGISSYGFDSPQDFCIDEKVKEFGSHFLAISPGEFLKKIEAKLKFFSWTYKHGFIDYYDKKSINGKINLFQKPKEYEYQKEFRIYVERKAITPLIFKIGSLKEIAEIYSSDDTGKIELVKRNRPTIAGRL